VIQAGNPLSLNIISMG